jgi:uncharacterized protein YaiI (UPF0178 family)
MLQIYVDADGCPVKDEVFRVARRHSLHVFLVANTVVRGSAGDQFESIVVRGGLNEADDWIAEHVGPGDIVITADIPLADRALQKGASVLGTTGRPFDSKNIGKAIASRDLFQDLRMAGTLTGGPKPFRKEDRSRFLSALEEMVRGIQRRASAGPAP